MLRRMAEALCRVADEGSRCFGGADAPPGRGAGGRFAEQGWQPDVRPDGRHLKKGRPGWKIAVGE